MRITRCKEKSLEKTHLLLKWGENEIPKVHRIEAVDIGMANALAFPKEYLERVLKLNPKCRVSPALSWKKGGNK